MFRTVGKGENRGDGLRVKKRKGENRGEGLRTKKRKGENRVKGLRVWEGEEKIGNVRGKRVYGDGKWKKRKGKM
jgi:hypothetical protein